MGFAFPRDWRAVAVEDRAGEVPHARREATSVTTGCSCAWTRSTPPEMRELVVDAWSMVVPQKVIDEFRASTQSEP